MISRPKPLFLQKMTHQDPGDLRKKLIGVYKSGGLKEFEPNVAECWADVKVEQIIFTDQYTHEQVVWVYVGDFWWCRKREFKRKDLPDKKYTRVKRLHYEFARLMAIENTSDGKVVFDGLWDCRRHVSKVEPIVVFKDSLCGVVVGWNEFEFLVDWGSGVGVPERDGKLVFKYVDDFNRFKNLIRNMSK